MRYFSGVVMVAVLLASISVYAGDKTEPMEKWLKDMRSMVEKVVPKKAPANNTSAVSGVRSADENTGDPLYWRGKKENISEEQLSEFSAALATAEAGKTEEAIRQFNLFLKHYPSGPLSNDAKITIEKLKGS